MKADRPQRIIVMGVSGSGKSTVGRALADRLALAFVEADDLHDPAAVGRMSRGLPLTDADRAPWLTRVGAAMTAHPGGVVVACSALARRYRDTLRGHAPGVWFLQLDVDRDVLVERMASRPGHFMPASLLESQLDTLEALATDEGAVIDGTGDDVVARALDAVQRAG